MGCAWHFVPEPRGHDQNGPNQAAIQGTFRAAPSARPFFPLDRLAGGRRLFGAVEDLTHPVPFRFELP